MSEVKRRLRIGLMVGAVVSTGSGAWLATAASAHEWYPYSCCSDKDCQPVADSAVEFTPAGWRVRNTGETIPFSKARVSPDGRFHICSFGGLPDGKTICLFAPGMGS